MSEILTPKQLAARIQRPERTLESWRRNGGGPKFYRLGRQIAYPVAEVERWLEANAFSSRADELARQQAAA